jgi:hypothetical protein
VQDPVEESLRGVVVVGVEHPSWPQWSAESQRIGLVDWKAREWFDLLESTAWEYKRDKVRNWRAFLVRIMRWWESDGRPMQLASGRKQTDVEKKISESPVIRAAREKAAAGRVITNL